MHPYQLPRKGVTRANTKPKTIREFKRILRGTTMVHKNDSEGKKNRVVGRPFVKGHKRGRPPKQILDDSGHQSGDEGRAVTQAPLSAKIEQNNHKEREVLENLHNEVMETLDNTLKESMNTPQEEETPKPKDESKELELIECIEFKDANNNKLEIRFSKRHNRMFRIQIFLNDDSEIRPVTYTGASTGYAFWNILKKALKK